MHVAYQTAVSIYRLSWSPMLLFSFAIRPKLQGTWYDSDTY